MSQTIQEKVLVEHLRVKTEKPFGEVAAALGGAAGEVRPGGPRPVEKRGRPRGRQGPARGDGRAERLRALRNRPATKACLCNNLKVEYQP
jgi:hypothetical protein